MSTPAASRDWTVRAIVLVLIVLGGSILYPFLRDFRRASQRSVDRDFMKQIMLAVRLYEESNGSFPPAYVAGPDGRRWHSWRALILPQLGRDDIAKKYRWDEPWDGPHNRELAELRPDVFVSRESGGGSRTRTNVVAIVGAATMWPEQYAASLSDLHDGAPNTVCLVNDASSDIGWLEPRDLAFDQRDQLLDAPGSEVFLAAMADGQVRAISKKLDRETWRKLLTAASGEPFRGVDFPVSDELLQRALPRLVDAETLSGVTVSAHEQIPIGETTIVACASFPLAWKALAARLGTDQVSVPDSTVDDDLNQSRLIPGDLDPDSFLAVGGFTANDADVATLTSHFTRLFPGRPMNLLSSASPKAVFAVAAIKKQLPFRHPFDILSRPLEFRGHDSRAVRAFGIEHVETRNNVSPLDSQVEVIDYRGENDFIVRLTTAGTRRDHIILARIPPGTTLGETWDVAQKRLDDKPVDSSARRLKAGETLQIPCLSLGASCRYPELMGRVIEGTDFEITTAQQDLQLVLDEKGAWLVSVSEVIGENGHDSDAASGIRKLVFDRPFLMAFKEQNSEKPYFLAWIGNTALMTPQ